VIQIHIKFHYREHFPYYKANDDKWKNSVRHNLSISPHFQKGSKAPHGAGHLWVLADNDKYLQSVKVRILEIFLFLILVLKLCTEGLKKCILKFIFAINEIST
jgi:hypothetical protein